MSHSYLNVEVTVSQGVVDLSQCSILHAFSIPDHMWAKKTVAFFTPAYAHR